MGRWGCRKGQISGLVRTRSRRLMMFWLLRGMLRLGSSKGKPPKTITYSMMPIAHTSAMQADQVCSQLCNEVYDVVKGRNAR